MSYVTSNLHSESQLLRYITARIGKEGVRSSDVELCEQQDLQFQNSTLLSSSYSPPPITAFSLLSVSPALPFIDNANHSLSFTSFAHSCRSGGRVGGRGKGLENGRERSRGRGGGDKDKIDALADEIREAVRKDNNQRFSVLEENGELMIRANQGHTITTVESESLLKPILSAEDVPVCVHGTYKKYLEYILESVLKRMKRLHVHFSSGLPTEGEVISGMRRDVNVLIFLAIRKALGDGMKLYMSDNRVILTEGFDGVVPVKYFEKLESWPDRLPIPL